MYGIGPHILSPLKSFMDPESGIELWLIRRYITIHSRALQFTKGGMGHLSAAGVLHPSERSDQSHSSWSDPNGFC